MMNVAGGRAKFPAGVTSWLVGWLDVSGKEDDAGAETTTKDSPHI